MSVFGIQKKKKNGDWTRKVFVKELTQAVQIFSNFTVADKLNFLWIFLEIFFSYEK